MPMKDAKEASEVAPFRQASDSGGWPPRSVPPANANMAKSFDRLVESNLRLVAVVRLALFVLVILTGSAVVMTVYSSWTMRNAHMHTQELIVNILQQCYSKDHR